MTRGQHIRALRRAAHARSGGLRDVTPLLLGTDTIRKSYAARPMSLLKARQILQLAIKETGDVIKDQAATPDFTPTGPWDAPPEGTFNSDADALRKEAFDLFISLDPNQDPVDASVANHVESIGLRAAGISNDASVAGADALNQTFFQSTINYWDRFKAALPTPEGLSTGFLVIVGVGALVLMWPTLSKLGKAAA